MINFVHTVEQATYEIKTAKDLLSCFNDFCEENLSFSDDEREQCYLGLMFMENMKKYKSLILTAEDIIRNQTELLDEATDNVIVEKSTLKELQCYFAVLGYFYLETCLAADESDFFKTNLTLDPNYICKVFEVSADAVTKAIEKLIRNGVAEPIGENADGTYTVRIKKR